jgi:hypothetical protein
LDLFLESAACPLSPSDAEESAYFGGIFPSVGAGACNVLFDDIAKTLAKAQKFGIAEDQGFALGEAIGAKLLDLENFVDEVF